MLCHSGESMTNRSDGQKFPHWSADFVEHIRTVHFALIAACLGLIGLVQFKKPLEVSTARRQLQDIKSAVDRWNSDEILTETLQQTGVPSGMPMIMPENGKVRNAFRVN